MNKITLAQMEKSLKDNGVYVLKYTTGGYYGGTFYRVVSGNVMNREDIGLDYQVVDGQVNRNDAIRKAYAIVEPIKGVIVVFN